MQKLGFTSGFICNNSLFIIPYVFLLKPCHPDISNTDKERYCDIYGELCGGGHFQY